MTMTPALLGHFRRMQTAATNYLIPDSYTPQFGEQAGVTAYAEGDDNRNGAFIGDMIYALDGPEQREAEAEAAWDYIAETDVTASDVYGGENSDAQLLSRDFRTFIEAAQRLDKHKKVLFRKRSPNEAGLPNPGPKCITTDLYFHKNVDSELLHGIIGVCTEAGELAEVAWGRMVLGKRADVVNVREEIGDILWYLARLLRWAGSDFLSEMRRNIAKLRKRHGNDGFNAEGDANRDLTAERAVLERTEAPVDRPRQPGDFIPATSGFAEVIEPARPDTSFRGYDQPMIDHQPDPNTRDMFEIPETFDAEEVAAAQDMDASKPGYDPGVSDRARTQFEGMQFPDEPHMHRQDDPGLPVGTDRG
jgi:NTP pyrophosphatase (non-canonical NTP hydrolase)